jgi:large subunit ribosomal protein L25
MSDQEIALTLEKREVVGKGLNQLRRDGQVPAVVHDHGKESLHVMAAYGPMVKVFQAAGKHHPVNLTVGSQKYMALIKDIDFEPRKHTVRHVVFNAIKADEKQQTEVPVRFTEDAEIPAEKAGLMIIRNLDVVEIEALPKDLIDEIVIDPSKLTEIGDKLTVADLTVPNAVTILTEPEHAIATVEETKAQMSEEAEEAETAEGEEGAAPAEGGEGGEKAAPEAATADEAKTE